MESFLKKSYIVRIWENRESEDHRVYLDKNLRANGWKWITRRNPASSFWKDFGLVSIWDLFQTGLIEELMGLGLVRDVSLEESYSRSLLVENGGKRNMNGYERAGFCSGINKGSANAKMKKKKKKNVKMMREKDDVFGNSTESLFQEAGRLERLLNMEEYDVYLVRGMRNLAFTLNLLFSVMYFLALLFPLYLWSNGDLIPIVQIISLSLNMTVLLVYSIATITLLFMYCKALHNELAGDIVEECLLFDDQKVPDIVSVVLE